LEQADLVEADHIGWSPACPKEPRHSDRDQRRTSTDQAADGTAYCGARGRGETLSESTRKTRLPKKHKATANVSPVAAALS
jgi:hypothetical protein